MSVDPWILTFSLVTVVVTIFMGFWSAKKSKTASDFFVAGRSVSVGWNASAISGEYLSAASFMGVAGMVMSSGYDALWYPVCYACGYLFLLLFIAGPLRRFGAYTIPDFAEGRYDSPIFRKIAVCFVLFIGFFYTMPQMKGAGTTLAYIFPGMPYWGGVVLVGAVITLNVALGGMKGITLVQAFQYWAKMFAISVPIFVLMSVYGHYGKQLEVNNGKEFKLIYQPPSKLELKARGVVGEKLADSVHLDRPDYPSFRSDWLTHFGLLKNYGLFQGKSVEVFAPNRNLYEAFPFTTNWVSPTNFCELAKPLFAKYGFRIVEENDYVVRFVSIAKSTPAPPEDYSKIEKEWKSEGWDIEDAKANAPKLKGEYRIHQYANANGDSSMRPIYTYSVTEFFVSRQNESLKKNLPEKAPADAKWISPFGPLTTKAAAKAGLKAEEAKPLSLLYTYSLIIALVCGTAGLPHILVRFYTNPDGVAAKRTTMWVMILIGVFYVFPPVFGVMGRNFLPDLYTGSGAKGTDKVVLELPRILNDASVETARRAVSEPTAARQPDSETPHRGVSTTKIPWGSVLSGITCAGAFAAFMSTFSGLLVSMTGALAHDVYGRILKPKSTPEQRMRMFKWCAVFVGGVAILLGMQVEQLEINFMVGQAFAIAAASYFPLLFMSVWWRGMTQKGAATGMLTGGLLALGCITLTSISDLALKAAQKSGKPNSLQGLEDFWIHHPAIRILCEQPAIWAVPLAIMLMIVVSKLTRKEVPSDIRMKMLVLHAPEQLGLKQEYIQEHQAMGH